MKIVLAISLILALSAAAFAQEIKAKTADGKNVILKSDGTWTYAPIPDKSAPALIYVYRLKEPGLYNRGIDFFVDGRIVIEIKQGDFVGFRLPPGKHALRTNKDDSEITIVAEPGEKYFVHFVAASGGFSQTHVLNEMTESQAVFHIKKTKAIDEKQIKDKTNVVLTLH